MLFIILEREDTMGVFDKKMKNDTVIVTIVHLHGLKCSICYI